MYKGKVWKVGNDVDTDVIIAARYLNDASDENMRKHCLEDAIPNFSQVISVGDILVAGKNFGCGSSGNMRQFPLKCLVSAVLLPKALPVFFIATPSILVCRLSPVLKLRLKFRLAISWKLMWSRGL